MSDHTCPRCGYPLMTSDAKMDTAAGVFHRHCYDKPDPRDAELTALRKLASERLDRVTELAGDLAVARKEHSLCDHDTLRLETECVRLTAERDAAQEAANKLITGEHIKRLTYARPGLPARRAGIEALIALADIRELVLSDRGGFEAVSIEELMELLPK